MCRELAMGRLSESGRRTLGALIGCFSLVTLIATFAERIASYAGISQRALLAGDIVAAAVLFALGFWIFRA